MKLGWRGSALAFLAGAMLACQVALGLSLLSGPSSSASSAASASIYSSSFSASSGALLFAGSYLLLPALDPPIDPIGPGAFSGGWTSEGATESIIIAAGLVVLAASAVMVAGWGRRGI